MTAKNTMKSLGTLNLSITRENKRPDIAIEAHLTEPSLDLGVNSTPAFPADRRILPVDNTPATGSVWVPATWQLHPEYSSMLAIPVNNQWLCGLFDFCRPPGEVRDIC